MKEIEVIVDVRQIPESLDLVVVRQKLQVEGELHAIGGPSESRISLAVRKVKVSLSVSAKHGIGTSLVAHVSNIGFALLQQIEVKLECRVPDTTPKKALSGAPDLQEMIVEYGFFASERELVGPIMPGETRDYYLPEDFFEHAVKTARPLMVDKFYVVVRSGGDELGRVPGEAVKPYLEGSIFPAEVLMDRRVRNIVSSLSDADRQSAQAALESLKAADPAHWRNAQQHQSNKDVFFLRLSPELFMAVRRLNETNTIEVIDIFRADVIEGLMGTKEVTAAQ